MTTLGLDGYLEIATDRTRRRLIQQLRLDEDGRTTVAELAEAMTDGHRPSGVDRPPDPEGIAVDLYHRHLPKLADLGVVEFDPDSRAVRYLPDERMEAVVDSVHQRVPRADVSRP